MTEFFIGGFPSLDDGPQGCTWLPVQPNHAGPARRDTADRAFKLSVRSGDGTVYRFLLTREGMAWIVFAALCEMSPWLAWLAARWWRAQRRTQRQAERSSGTPRRDGSPQEGQAV